MVYDQKQHLKISIYKKFFLFFEILVYSGISRVLTRFIKFQSILIILGLEQSKEYPSDPILCQTTRLSVYLDILSKCLPWRFKCLEKAISASLYLKRRNIFHVVFFGVCKTSNGLVAHAWLKVGGDIVTGGENVSKYKVLAEFS